MTAGYFTRTYEVWRYTETTDPAGQPIQEWDKLTDVPGRAYQKSINYKQSSAFAISTEDWTFACSADTDIKNDDQVRFDGRTLTVKGVSVTSRGDRLECLCNEVQP